MYELQPPPLFLSAVGYSPGWVLSFIIAKRYAWAGSMA